MIFLNLQNANFHYSAADNRSKVHALGKTSVEHLLIFQRLLANKNIDLNF